jgi:hypothetical protein
MIAHARVLLRVSVGVVLTFAMAGTVRADLNFSIEPAPGSPHLRHLVIGETFQVDVTLSTTDATETLQQNGLTAGISNLQEVTFTSVAVNMQSGDHIPVSPSPGNLMTYTLLASAAGSGYIQISGTISTNMESIAELGTIDYTVTGVAVPEPSSAVVAAIGAAAFIAYGWSRHPWKQRRRPEVPLNESLNGDAYN